MRRTILAFPTAHSALVGALSTLLLALAGCDNPACVFGGHCTGATGSSGALGTSAASTPADGELLLPGLPTVEGVFPTGTGADPKTPIVVRFDESMSSANLASAFELVQNGIGAIPLNITALLGDGRLLVLFPVQDLTLGGEYTLEYRTNVKVADRSGQEIAQPTDRVLGSFSVAATAPSAPAVLTQYPARNALDQSSTSEIDVVFTRPVEAVTVDGTSFDVTVDGAAPPFDATPQPLTVGGAVTDTRVYRWRSLDSAGFAASLGTDKTVMVSLSPAGNEITDADGHDLPATTWTWKTLAFRAPSAARITSTPTDAIGIDSISGPEDLAIEVTSPDAVSGDKLDVYIVGTQPENVTTPIKLALFREVALTAPFTTFTLTASEIDLVRSTSPLAAKLADGTVDFAFELVRGQKHSAVRRIDVDTTRSGPQSPVLDTVAPTLLGLGETGTSAATFRSDARDLVLVGRASESLRGALVETAIGTNETVVNDVPPVVGSDATTGLFVAAPVPVGVLSAADTPLTYTLTIYDRAMNHSGATTGQFTQVGVASGGTARPFRNVSIRVFDAVTLAPVANANVTVHEDLLGDLSFVDGGTTNAQGAVTLGGALLGSTIVTVEKTGYDLFTFDAIPTDRLDVPLRPTAQANGTVSGLVTATDADVTFATRSLYDTRFPRPGATAVAVGACSFSTTNQRFECPFAATQVRSAELGAESALAVIVPSNILLFTPSTFLRGFGLKLPLGSVGSGAAQSSIVPVTALGSAGLPEEQRPIEVTPTVLALSNWPTALGTPRVTIEGLSPGLKAGTTVGAGVAFDVGVPDSFALRAAYAGVADPFEDGGTDELGTLVQDGVIGPDLFLRAEVEDSAGNRGGARPRLSTMPTTLTPPPPSLVGPGAITLASSGLGYELAIDDVFADSDGQPGIYRATVSDVNGRRWTVWKLDGPNDVSNLVTLHLPFLGAGPAFPLAAGDLGVATSAWSWATFDTQSFLWTDVEREFDRSAHAASVTVTPP